MWSRRISNERYYEEWHPIHASIFRPGNTLLEDFALSKQDTVFVDDTWRVVMLPYQLCVQAEWAFEELVEDEREENVFQKPDQLIWRAFLHTVREAGDERFVSSTLFRQFMAEESPIHFAAVFDIVEEGPCVPSETGDQYSILPVAFGKSGRWGAICDTEDETLVGGDEDFIASLIDKCGGIEIMQQRYLREVEREMIYSDDQEFHTKLCDKIGWPRPKFTKTVSIYWE